MDRLSAITITDVEGIMTVFSPSGRYEKITDRKCYGLSFCTQGQITYTHNGKKYVSDKNHAIILPQGQSYSLFGDKKGIFPVINFKCADFLCDTFMVLPVENMQAFIKDYEQMKALSLFAANRLKIIGILYNIFHRLCAQAPADNILVPAIRYIEKNYQNPNLTNALIAKEIAISEVYFRKIFTEYYKISPKQYIIDIRINNAKQMLSEGVFKINVIAEKCGFSNPYHFCRQFKERVGVTPTEYSKQNRIYKI